MQLKRIELRGLASAALILLASLAIAPGQTSRLWGTNGELWSASGRLPDFSHAGYRRGEAPIPELPAGTDVRHFGAKGDGVTDDTEAFLKAIAAPDAGVIEIPPGRYVITAILEIRRSGVVLRGAGPDKTVLYFPKPLEEIRPDQSATTSGRPTSNYSWSGGFIWFEGSFGGESLGAVTSAAQRGETTLRTPGARGVKPGQSIELVQTDNVDQTLARELYSDDPGDTGQLGRSTRTSFVARVVEVSGDQVRIDRPLRTAVRPEWSPRIRRFEPTVTRSGVENLALEFPNTPYEGHFTELGFNGIAFGEVADCWARRIRIVNPDSGIMIRGHFCTVEDVVFETARRPDPGNCTAHHGIYIYGNDNLCVRFDFRMRFIHDLTVSGSAGNVFANGSGVDLCFDHHKRAPHENLFSNIDAGAGTRLWRSGGGAALGKHCGARGTFWNIRASAPLNYPPPAFGPWSMNLVGLKSEQAEIKENDGRWFEVMTDGVVVPKDLHAAQRERRMDKISGR